jgi:hypothetical protein
MHTHNFLIDKSNQWQVVEALIKCLPESNFVSSLDFIKETVNSGDGLAFVVTSKNDDLLRISNFQSEEETDDLAGLSTSVDIITHE